MDINQIRARLVQSFYDQAVPLIELFDMENEADRCYLQIVFYQALKKFGAPEDELAKLDEKIRFSLLGIPTRPEQDCEMSHYISVNKNYLSDETAFEMIQDISDPEVRADAFFTFADARLSRPLGDSENISLFENLIEEVDDLIQYEILTVKFFFACEKFRDQHESLMAQQLEELEVPHIRALCLLRLLCEKNDNNDNNDNNNNNNSPSNALNANEDLLRMIRHELGRLTETIFDWNVVLPFLIQLPDAQLEFLNPEELVQTIEKPDLRIQAMSEFLKTPYLKLHPDVLKKWTADIKKIASENEKDLALQMAIIRFLFLSDPENRQGAIEIVQNTFPLIRQEGPSKQVCSFLELYEIHSEAGEKKAARQILDLAEKKALELDPPEAKSFYLNNVLRVKVRRKKKNAEALSQLLELSEVISSALYRLPLRLSIRLYLDLLSSFDSEEDLIRDLEEKTLSELNALEEFQERVYILSELVNRLSEV